MSVVGLNLKVNHPGPASILEVFIYTYKDTEWEGSSLPPSCLFTLLVKIAFTSWSCCLADLKTTWLQCVLALRPIFLKQGFVELYNSTEYRYWFREK
jgi:hypothetical protein